MLQTIAAEVATLDEFIALLTLEQTALGNGNTDELPALAEQKSKFAVQLNDLATQRNRLLTAQGFAADRAGVEQWCARHAENNEPGQTWSRILSLASEARELNRLNGELIQMRMQYNTQALEALRGTRNSLQLYGPDGQSTASGHRRINDAV